jgi:hypothetical protein
VASPRVLCVTMLSNTYGTIRILYMNEHETHTARRKIISPRDLRLQAGRREVGQISKTCALIPVLLPERSTSLCHVHQPFMLVGPLSHWKSARFQPYLCNMEEHVLFCSTFAVVTLILVYLSMNDNPSQATYGGGLVCLFAILYRTTS